MKIQQIDNSIDLLSSILWQYQTAPNLTAIAQMLNQYSYLVTTEFFNYFRDKVLDIESAEAFGLDLWGQLLGVPRPNVDIDGVSTVVSDGFYRRILKGHFYIQMSNGSTEAIVNFENIVFDGRVSVTDGLDMSINYTYNSGAMSTEELAVMESNTFSWEVLIYPAGVLDNTPVPFDTTKAIGLNDTQSVGQKLNNFANTRVAAASTANGGVIYPG